MTLIIGTRCKDGWLVISDKRNKIQEQEDETPIYEDNLEKVVIHNKCLIYNHGYNQIGRKYWKNRYQELTADISNPIYGEVRDEMKDKPFKKAYYTFINRKGIEEISVEVDSGVHYNKKIRKEDKIVSGDGKIYVDFSLIKDPKNRSCFLVKGDLEFIFKKAHDKMKKKGGEIFSKDYEICSLLFKSGTSQI